MKLLVFIIVLGIGFSCQKKADPLIVATENVPISSEPADAYSQSKAVNGYVISVAYQPRLNNGEGENLDDQSLHFLMEIEADGENRTGNFLYHEVYGASDFNTNVSYFNFEIINDISVEVDGEAYQVVLSNMENTYTLDDKRKIHFVAVPPTSNYTNKNIQKISFVYDDFVLGVGKLKFMFIR